MRAFIAILLIPFAAVGAEYRLQDGITNLWTPGVTVGVRGGIPTGQTIFTNLSSLGGGLDDGTNITASIGRCPSNQVVKLAAGEYNLVTSIIWGLDDQGVVLRGSGMNQTIFTNGYVTAFEAIDSSETRRNFIASVIKGSTNVQFNSFHEDIQPGRHIYITYSNNPQPMVWSTHFSGGPATDIRADTNSQMTFACLVLSTNTGNTATIYPPAPFTFTSNTSWGGTYVSTRASIGYNRIGIEDLTVTNVYGTNGWQMSPPAPPKFARFARATECWIKNVGSWYPTDDHFVIENAVGFEVRGCVTMGVGLPGVGIAGFNFENNCSALLIEDNISEGVYPFLHFENGSSMVGAVAYNYIRSPIIWTDGWITGWVISHGGYNGWMIFEGNDTEGFYMLNDYYHATAGHWTLFRNRSQGTVSFGHGYTNRCWALDFGSHGYTNAVINSILGDSNVVWNYTTTNFEFAIEGSGNSNYIMRAGYPNTGNTSFTGIIPPEAITNTHALDHHMVTNTLTWHGTYDYARQTTVNIAGESTTFADSWIYNSKPTWFSNATYPPIGTDLTPMVSKIPARLRFEGLDYSDPAGKTIGKRTGPRGPQRR